MYQYVEDKKFLNQIRSFSGEIMQQVCHALRKDYDIGSTFCLVGSGAKNLILQNEKNPIDLDYNLEIVRCANPNDGRHIKECVRKTFNKILRKYHLQDCEDSTSSLTTKQIYLKNANDTAFSIDICIVKRDATGNYHRLIHNKSGFTIYDTYIWNMAPQSNELKKKADYIKKHDKWTFLREEYLKIKNRYLTWNDHNHPSFICYTQAVNNVYHALRHRW